MSGKRSRLAPAALAAALAVSCLSACTASTPSKPDASRAAVPSRQSEASSKGSARAEHSSRRGTTLTMKTNLQLSGRTSATRAEAGSYGLTRSPVQQLSATTPKVGSLEWEAEKQEAERREQYIRKVIQGICRGC